MDPFYCEVNQSRMCSSSIISQARKLSTVSLNRLLCINSLYYYATILLSSVIECGKHIILSAECKHVSAIASDDNINNIFAESRLTLSPRGVMWVCPGAQLDVTCSTDRSFLRWTVTLPPSASDSGEAVTRSRLVSNSTQATGPFTLEMKQFNISITSTVDPFSSVLSYTNATADLNGTVINCSYLGYSPAESDSSMVIVHITTADLGRFTWTTIIMSKLIFTYYVHTQSISIL